MEEGELYNINYIKEKNKMRGRQHEKKKIWLQGKAEKGSRWEGEIIMNGKKK